MMIKNVKEFCVQMQYLLGRHLQLQKNCMINKNNDDLQLLFCPPPSDALRNPYIDFSCSCSYITKLLSPVLLAFQLPIKNRTCVFMKQFIVKNHNSFQSGLSVVPSSENTWISSFFSFIKYISTKNNS